MPVADPVPVVLPEDELPVVVLDGLDGVVLVAPVGVPDEEPLDVPVESVREVPVELPVPVGDVEESGVVEVLPSEGAVGLAPPPLIAVEVPPVARTLTLTGPVVVIEVVSGPDGSVRLDAGADLAVLVPAGFCVGEISTGPGSAADDSRTAVLGADVLPDADTDAGAVLCGGATTAARA